MEIESDNGDNFRLKLDAPISIGRSQVNDRTVSRHHISLELLHSSNPNSNKATRVSLKAVGRNPVWVRNCKNGEIRVYRKGERAELRSGDGFSISGKKHVWFRLRSEDEIGVSAVDAIIGDVSDLEFEGVDVAAIDPFKEFGFVITGHEFDSYNKRIIHDMSKWNWFLEEPKKGSDGDDDDNATGHSKEGKRRKRKKGKHDGQGDDDDEWECESEEDKNLISNSKKIGKPSYSTRSKSGKSTKFGSIGKGKSKSQESMKASKEELRDDDEDDETLGGFIIDNEDEIEDDIGGSNEEDEEDEFEDDDDNDLD